MTILNHIFCLFIRDFETTMSRMEDVRKDVINQKKREEELGLTEEEYVFYETVAQGKQYVKSDDVLKSVAIQLTDFLKINITIDWMNQESIKAKIRAGVKKISICASLRSILHYTIHTPWLLVF